MVLSQRRHYANYILALFACLFGQMAAYAQDWNYTVRPGDTLWGISERFLIDGTAKAPDLQAHNTIANPYQIPPGTRIKVPVKWLEQQPVPAQALVVQGEVMRTPTGGTPARLNNGDELNAGDLIRTGDGASITIQFADDSSTVVRPNSELTLDVLSVFQGTGMVNTTMRLHGGRVDNNVPKRAQRQSRFRIITPSAIAAVRGTGFRVGYDTEVKTALSEVVDGEVGFGNATANRGIARGFGVTAEEGQPPSQPIRLLDAPNLGDVDANFTRKRMAFAWVPVTGAIAYQVQILAGELLVLDERVATPAFDRDAIANGSYTLAVRAIDNNGLEGLEAQREISVDAHPFPPVLDNPVADAVLREPPEFRWTPGEQAGVVRIQVARDDTFSDIILDESVEQGTRLTAPASMPGGTLFWRASTVAERAGRFSEAQRFEFIRVPGVPEPSVRHFKDNRLWIDWAPIDAALHYELELAHDQAFTNVVAKSALSKSQFVLEFVEAGSYYYRVRSVGDKRESSAFSPTQSVRIEPEISDPLWQLKTPPQREF